MTLRRVVPLTLVTLASLLAIQPYAHAASPLDEHGLLLADGRRASTPIPAVWGAALDPALHAELERRASALRAEPGRVWISWDGARRAARELLVSGVRAPGAMRSGLVARMFAELWLQRHLELLAPGSSLDDFELVANDSSAGLRSLGFRQLHDGVPVVGGQLSLIFAGDKLVHVGSQALPNVALPSASSPLLPASTAFASARAWIAADYPSSNPRALAQHELVVLPLFSGGQWQYREVLRVEVRSDTPVGHWAVYVDARSGAVVAREQLLRSAGTLRYNVPTRHPLAAREDALVPEVGLVENGMNKTTNLVGQWNLGSNPAAFATSVAGPRINVNNTAGADATTNLMVGDGQTAIWNASGNEFTDAQLSAFVHASRGKAYVRAIDPSFAWLDQTLTVDVNINDACNAFADDQGIHFFRSSNQCANMAQLADVVIHELGHRVHGESIIDGVGAFDGALSEGVSDYLPTTMANDSGMGRGFFKSNAPLRELNPNGMEWIWPNDISDDPHLTGRIIGGALWDLRAGLIADMGMQAGVASADNLYYQAIRRAVDIPSMYAQVVLADDDNADISDGTPNICLINQVFAAHGLYQLDTLADIQIELDHQLEGYVVSAAAAVPMFVGCPDSIDSMTLRWRLRDDPNTIQELPMQLVNGVWTATIPTQAAGTVVEYRVEGSFTGGTTFGRSLNLADPWYQAYFGAVEQIYCLDANADLAAWTLNGNLWSFDALMPGGPDPTLPYDGDGVQLSMDGNYAPDSNYLVTSPMIDISGWDDVRLHYYRWLSVEDALYDHARIRANGQEIWANVGTPGGQTQHVDREWRFHDVELAAFIPDGQVQLTFELSSDPGLEFGGWNIDALCVVAVGEQICGDGQVDSPEQCDDGNTVDGDGCDAQCQLEQPVGTDTGTDSGGTDGSGTDSTTGSDPTTSTSGASDSTGDTGIATGTESSGDAGIVESDGCNCSTSDEPRPWSGAWLLALAGLGVLRRRREDA